MHFLSDLLLATGAIGAAAFCLVLSRRLRALTTLDSGMGRAIATLSAQVDDLAGALKAAQQTSRAAAGKLDTQTRRAEAACRRLELLMAALHDLPPPPGTPPETASPSATAAHARPPSSWNAAAARRPASAAGAGTPLETGTAGRAPRLLRRRPAVAGS